MAVLWNREGCCNGAGLKDPRRVFCDSPFDGSGATQRVRDLVTEGVQVQNLGICEIELLLLRPRYRAGEETPVVAVSALGLDPWLALDDTGVADLSGIGSDEPRDDLFSDAP